MILRTQRIKLSQLEIEDLNYIHSYTSDYSNLTPFFSTKIRSKVYWLEKFKKDGLWSDQYGMMKVIDRNKNKIIGIITDGDIRRSLKKINLKEYKEVYAKEIMSKNPLSISEDLLAIEALKLMDCNAKSKVVSSLAVLDKEKNIVGVIRSQEIIKCGLKV